MHVMRETPEYACVQSLSACDVWAHACIHSILRQPGVRVLWDTDAFCMLMCDFRYRVRMPYLLSMRFISYPYNLSLARALHLLALACAQIPRTITIILSPTCLLTRAPFARPLTHHIS